MAVVHFIDGRTVVLSQYLANIPAVDQAIKVKGRKGKVINVIEIDENQVQVYVELEAKNKNQVAAKDTKKKKR
ncbi:hypothetical protein [Bacillus sp. PS06]|uniref:hypothetical protein n=1 Tax=Bacillus sp. PS06 TaxID=2764176 RepID=UPI001781C178|nr:hypothetical protein [Bacillus sp. PS06]MBD8067854.1 hypothetical protein [Bacillus sp. PS06]